MAAKYDIFISHSSEDKPLVDKFVSLLLNNGCDITSDRILCSSLEGMGIPAGTPSFVEYLRENIQNRKLVILLLTENFFASNFCVCELGATWGFGMNTFPLVVPPLDKSSLKATLKVTIAGSILEKSYLDELPEAIISHLGSKVNMPRWNVKCAEFLKGAQKIINALPKPATVNRSKLNEVEANYQAALDELSSKDDETETLKSQIEDLKKLKDAKQVKVVMKKYSSTEAQFESLRKNAREALQHVYASTGEALYQKARESEYCPSQGDDDAAEALECEEIREGSYGYIPNDCHQRVGAAENALNEIRHFLRLLPVDDPFLIKHDDENDYPLSFTNREFWDNNLF